MTVEESMHVVFDKTNPKLQDQVSKNADEEDLLQEQISAIEKSTAAGNQLAKKEKQSTEKAADNKLPKDWIQPRGLSKDNIIGDINQGVSDEGVTTSLEVPSRRITRSMSRRESSIPSPLSLFCITLV